MDSKILQIDFDQIENLPDMNWWNIKINRWSTNGVYTWPKLQIDFWHWVWADWGHFKVCLTWIDESKIYWAGEKAELNNSWDVPDQNYKLIFDIDFEQIERLSDMIWWIGQGFDIPEDHLTFWFESSACKVKVLSQGLILILTAIWPSQTWLESPFRPSQTWLQSSSCKCQSQTYKWLQQIHSQRNLHDLSLTWLKSSS